VRLILADAGLKGPAGHHLNYAAALAGAARQRGLSASILVHREFIACAQAGDLRVVPVFSALYQAGGGSGRLRGVLFSACCLLPPPLSGSAADLVRRTHRAIRPGRPDAFGRELAAALADLQCTDSDFLVLPSVSSANLAGLADALAPTVVGRIAIVLRRLPEEMDQSDPGPTPVDVILRRLQGHFGSRLRLYADTEPLADLWRHLLGVPVFCVPVPVDVPAVQERQTGLRPHLVFAGGARIEKGYALLPEIAAALKATARFTIQSGLVDGAADPVVQRAHRALKEQAGPHLQLVEHALAPDEYLALIRDADLLLLPYDPSAYGPRSSGILAEARALAIPAIVPRDCWMEQAAGPARTCAFDYPSGFGASIRQALTHLGPLTAAMREAAPAWRQLHNARALLDVLLGDDTKTVADSSLEYENPVQQLSAS
jgi:glycosyltransferase involved in cell wall biosynthesis